jgi:very-short-patch-repair endonuclease
LKGKNLEGIKFRRQEPIGDYIVDFVAFEKRLVIEVDGGQHADQKEKDKDIQRDVWLGSQGFKVLRFWNNEVLQNLEGVLETIRVNCFRHPPLTPPIRGGEKE